METLLRFMNARSFLLLGGAAALIALAVFATRAAREKEEERRLAAERGATPSPDILEELNARESAKLHALHRRVSGELAAAEAKGYRVDRLKALADGELAFDTPAMRAGAIERLNRLRLAIPKNAESFRPAGLEEDVSDVPPSPRGHAEAR